MRHQAIREGTCVYLKDTNVLDENGQPWEFGNGPFLVARVITPKGYREPWLRLYRGYGSAADELPGSFRAKELRLPKRGELDWPEKPAPTVSR